MRLPWAFTFLALGPPGWLYPQEPATPVPDSAPHPAAPLHQLPEVEVTTSRTGRDLFGTPLAITVINRDQLENHRGIALDEALRSVPGVLAQSRAGGTDIRLAIRGFGSRGAASRSNAGTIRGVRVLVDGFPETEPDGRTSLDAIDLAAAETIEVVRSNATSLWGNAAGGVVSVSTVPSVERHFGWAQSTVGAFGLRRGALRAGTRLATGQMYVAASRTTGDGWRRNSAYRRVLATSGYVHRLGPSTDLRLSLSGVRNEFGIPGPLRADEVRIDPQQANSTYAARRERRDNLLGRIGMVFNHRPDPRTQISALAFVSPKKLERSERGTFRRFNRLQRGGSLVARRALFGGTRVAGSVLAGADVALQSGPGRFYSLDASGGQGPELVADREERSRNLGLFLESSLSAGERLTLTAGTRFDVIAYDYRDHLEPRLDARKSFRRLTPKIAVNWRLAPTQSVYAALGGGLEAPAGNETDPPSTFGQDTVTAISPLLEPIRSTTYEVGTRHLLMLSPTGTQYLRYDVAAYYTAVENEPVPYAGGRFYLTAGRVRRLGLELGVEARMAGGLSLETAFTYNHNRYTEYRIDSTHYGSPGQVADYAGHRAVGVPDFIYSANVGYAPAFLGALELSLSLQGIGKYFADDANRVPVPAHAVFDGTISLTEPVSLGGALELDAFVTVNNLLDRRYIGSAFLNPDLIAGDPVAFEPGLPRHLVLSLSLGLE